MGHSIPISKRRNPKRRRVRQDDERCPYTLTPAAKRALLLDNLRSGIIHKLIEQEN